MLKKNFLYLEKFVFIKIQFIFYIFLLIIEISFQTECEKSSPIKKQDNECYLIYCTKEEFEQEQCIINNPIIKIQWLTNIIRSGIYSCRFINFALSSKNELFLHTTTEPSSSNNYFFGLNSDGRPYFTISEEEVLVILLSYNSSSFQTRHNGEFISIMLDNKNNNREHMMSVGNGEDNVEIFNFETDDIFVYSTKVMTKYYIQSKKFALLHFIDNNNKNSSILAFIGKSIDNDKNYYVLQKYEFFHNTTIDKIDYKKTEHIKIENFDSSHLKFILSCFQTDKRLIICFYYNTNLYYIATLYDSDLNELNSFDLAQPSEEQNLFFKCLHLKKEIGIFYYFLGEIEESRKPKIDIIEFIKDSDQINYTRKYIFQSLTTKIDNILDGIDFNSIIKLNDNKFGIIQINENKEDIYIITYHIFNDNREIIGRYYKIHFKLYNFKIYNDVDSIVFNSFFISAFSFCPNIDGNEDCIYFYSSIIMFSYPDSKDYDINVIDYIKSDNVFPLEEIIENNTIIDNNIFGLIKKGIKIQLYPKDENNNDFINLYSKNNKKIINQNDIIEKNDKIEFYFPQPKINANQYKIEYSCVVTEPDYDIYNSYCDEIDSEHANINVEKSYFYKYDYIGKTGYLLLDVEKTLTSDCNDGNCFYCSETNKSICLIYKKPENKEEEIENYNNENLDGKQLTDIYKKLKEIIDKKSYDGGNVVLNMKDVLLQLSSVEFQEDSINDESATNVFLGECKDILKEKYNLQDSEVLLMLKLDLFKQNSSIPLVEYEVYNFNKSEKLNLEYCNDVKINVYVPIQLDNKTFFLYNNLNSSGYNLLDPNDSFYTDICSLYTTINGTDIPLSDRKKEYYNESLSLCQGDGCTYDYYNSTIKKVKCDCSISRTAIKNNNLTNLEEENDFISTIVDIYNNKEKLKHIFSSSIKNMNFKVMKCFQLVFKLEYFMKNIGSILLTILIIFYLLFMSLYFVLRNKIIKELIIDAGSNSKSKRKSFLKKKSTIKFKENNELKDCIDKSNDKNETKLYKKKSISNNIFNNQILIDSKDEQKEIIENKSKDEIKNTNFNRGIKIFKKGLRKILSSKIKGSKSPKFSCPSPKILKRQTSIRGMKKILNKSKTVKIEDSSSMNNLDKKINDSIIKNKDKSNVSKMIKIDLKDREKSLYSNYSENILNKKNSLNNSKKRKSSFVNKDKNDKETIIDNYKDDKDKNDNKNQLKNNNIIKKKLPKIENLNDEEINHLDYSEAIILDKRTFIQYYWSLLKKKQLILFTFYPSNDYNIRIIKMSFFIVSFSLYMTINGFFFSDSTMHKVYEDNGKFNIIYQIPQILYSTLVSMIINKLLKYLSLSENSILDLKNEKNKKVATGKSQKIEKSLKIKLFVYFILGFLLMLFFWYFISTFCAVYSNTQTILIKNTLISFLIYMIYPCGYALLPGIFRIPSLRAQNRGKICLYNFSKLVAII